MAYTCKVCETRQTRTFSKNSYHKGTVIIRCEGCQNLHLISDHLNYFGDKEVTLDDLIEKENLLKVKAEGKVQEAF